ncbi:hypothetical protein F5B20DRAFT_212414 [Whalleya microplaca]|nr:hypothetical protein F5B20DRAFT_212414 [Whalleya microplaca]
MEDASILQKTLVELGISKTMTSIAISSSTFHLFSALPPELRNQIWRYALPDKVGPALYFYRKGCWCPRRLTESDQGYHPEDDELNLNFDFRYDFLDDVQVEVPLAFVNREARGIALAWVREQGVEMRPRNNRSYPIFVRPLDPMRDALYITLDKWEDFIREPDERRFEPDLLNRLVDINPGITRIAISEALLQREGEALAEMFWNYYRVDSLLIIVNAQADLQPVDNDIQVQRRWEFESVQGETFLWNLDRRRFDFEDSEDSEDTGDEDIYQRIAEVKRLGRGLRDHDIHSFEVRLAFAVSR